MQKIFYVYKPGTIDCRTFSTLEDAIKSTITQCIGDNTLDFEITCGSEESLYADLVFTAYEDLDLILQVKSLPKLNEECKLFKIWDGSGEQPTESWAVAIYDTEKNIRTYVNYEFEILNLDEEFDDIIIKIINVYLVSC